MHKKYSEFVEEIKNDVREVSIEYVDNKLSENILVIDIREERECSSGLIPGAINIPRGILESNIRQVLEKQCGTEVKENQDDPELYLICRSGMRSILAAESLQRMGFENVYSVRGGMLEWDKKHVVDRH